VILSPSRVRAQNGGNRGQSNHRSADSALEGAVSSEPVSEKAKFPVTKENTGNFIDSGFGGAKTPAKTGIKSVPYTGFR
jgi:hypothetical protein